jgi:hypothetical protein
LDQCKDTLYRTHRAKRVSHHQLRRIARPRDSPYEVASLVGIPIFNLPKSAYNSSLLMEASYWHLHCPKRSYDYAGFPTGQSGPEDSPQEWQGNKSKDSVALFSNNTEYRGDYINSSFPSNLSARTILFRAYGVGSACR